MNKLAIDIYIGKHQFMWKESPFYAECGGSGAWDGETHPCTFALLEIERFNLYFVNKLITYEQLIAQYNKAADFIQGIPRIPTFKEQLQDAGKFVAGAVAGFFAAGPIGIFTGSAAAINEILAKERARRAARIQSLLDPRLDQVQQAEALIKHQEQMNKLKVFALWGGGALAVGGVVWWMLSE